MPGAIRAAHDPGNGGQQQRLQREEPDAGNEHRLDGEQNLQHQHKRSEQRDKMRADFGRWRVHGYRNRKVETSASVARTKAALRKSGTRNRRSFALVVSTNTTAPASTMSLAAKTSRPRPNTAGVPCPASPIGKRTLAKSAIRTSCL